MRFFSSASPFGSGPYVVVEATVERVLAEQRRYYRERAPEYDDWWFRRDAYALDPETEARWFADRRAAEP